MIFENHGESVIDDNLLKLVKKIKQRAGENPTVQLLSDQNSWVITVPEKWIGSRGIKITCYHLHKKKFRIWWEETVRCTSEPLMDISVGSIKQVVDTLLLLRYTRLNIPSEVIDFLATKCKTVSMETALKCIATETDIELNGRQIEVLGINEHRGRIIGKKFGL